MRRRRCSSSTPVPQTPRVLALARWRLPAAQRHAAPLGLRRQRAAAHGGGRQGARHRGAGAGGHGAAGPVGHLEHHALATVHQRLGTATWNSLGYARAMGAEAPEDLVAASPEVEAGMDPLHVTEPEVGAARHETLTSSLGSKLDLLGPMRDL